MGNIQQVKEMFRLFTILAAVIALVAVGCSHADDSPGKEVHEPLPENLVAVSSEGSVLAWYVDPVTRYDHGILGDKIEAGGMIVNRNGIEYYLRLDTTCVFEDLRPRIFDVDNDGEIEFITIRTRIDSGAEVCVYKILGETLQPVAFSGFIGTSHRWLNIASIIDLDGDGHVEIAWVETPHIGGTLKVARYGEGKLVVIDQRQGLSNHSIGSRNLCLSVTAGTPDDISLWLPDDPKQALVRFRFLGDRLLPQDTIPFAVDPAIPLSMQFTFPDAIEDENCIFVLPAGK